METKYQVRIYDRDYKVGRTWITGKYEHCREILDTPSYELRMYVSQPKRFDVNIVPVKGVRN